MTRHRPPTIPDEERTYPVGYRKPPMEHVFTKGTRANPSGRPKKARSNSEIIQELLSKPLKLRIGGKSVTISGREALLHAQLVKGINGVLKATEFLVRHSEDSNSTLDLQNLQAEDHAIIASFLEQLAADPKSTARSLALRPQGGDDGKSK